MFHQINIFTTRSSSISSRGIVPGLPGPDGLNMPNQFNHTSKYVKKAETGLETLSDLKCQMNMSKNAILRWN